MLLESGALLKALLRANLGSRFSDLCIGFDQLYDGWYGTRAILSNFSSQTTYARHVNVIHWARFYQPKSICLDIHTPKKKCPSDS